MATFKMNARAGSRAGGFTLVELLVVISVIVLLVGLGAVAMSVVQRRIQIGNTRQLLKAVEGAAGEYKIQTGALVPTKSAAFPQASYANNVSYFLSMATIVPTCNDQLQRFKQYLVLPVGASMQTDTVIQDDFGNTLEYRGGNTATSKDSTGAASFTSKLPAYDGPLFASSGPDKQWGDEGALRSNPNSTTPTQDMSWAKDNLYSFQIK